MKKKVRSLEVIRAVACMAVFISHFRVATTYFESSYFDAMQTFTAWGKEAVIIFFIISGIVLNISTEKKITKQEYFRKRLLRIYPIYFICILLSISACILITGEFPGWKDSIGNLLMLGTMEAHIVQTISFNAAVWSISCEMFFYVIYGILYTNKRIQNIWSWFIISFISILFRIVYDTSSIPIIYYFTFMLNMSFVWLIGYILYEYRLRFKVNLQTALLGLMMVPLATRMHSGLESLLLFKYHLAAIYLIPAFLYLFQDLSSSRKATIEIKSGLLWLIYIFNLVVFWNYSSSTDLNKLIYTVVPLLSTLFYVPAVSLLFYRIYKKISVFFLTIAGMSYAIYVIHVPIMYAISFILPNNRIIGVILIVVLTFVVGFYLENLFQKWVVERFSEKTYINSKSRAPISANSN